MIVYYASATKLKNTDCPKTVDRDTSAILVTIHSQYDELDEHMTIVSKKGWCKTTATEIKRQ